MAARDVTGEGTMRISGYAALAALLVATPLAARAQTPVAPPPMPPAQSSPGLADPLSVTPEDIKTYGSLYLRCDGQPNNVTGMESFARLMGAITLLGLFAPTPEAPDPAKRLFGDRGIAACTELLDNPKQETNVLRRVPLILARAIHRMEAKDYKSALIDIDKARAEAAALHLVGNPYFDRSMGLSFDFLEAHARLRLHDYAGAREAGLRNSARLPFSLYANAASSPFSFANRDLSPAEERYYRSSARILPRNILSFANRLDEVGRFAEAAETRLGFGRLTDDLSLSDHRSWPSAQAAVSYALAGEWDKAAANAAAAQKNLDDRSAAGRPEDDQTGVVEVLDFYNVLLLMHQGRIADARRNFASRSQWLTPSFGAVSAVTARLREGARPEELFGALQATPEALWTRRLDRTLAVMAENDTNNRTLFSFLLPFARIGDFERLSGNVWKTQKSRLISDKVMKDSKFWSVGIFSDALTQPDALLLHSANLAKERGFDSFAFFARSNAPENAFVMFANAADKAIPEQHQVNADAVIAELRQIIPSPAELAARRAVKKP